MRNLICMKYFGKITCFSIGDKMVFCFLFFFQNVILYFCSFERDTKIINSVSLYRCKYLLRYYHFNMVNFLQFVYLLDALLNATVSFKVYFNKRFPRLKFPKRRL